jgi:hypothetical protein
MLLKETDLEIKDQNKTISEIDSTEQDKVFPITGIRFSILFAG